MRQPRLVLSARPLGRPVVHPIAPSIAPSITQSVARSIVCLMLALTPIARAQDAGSIPDPLPESGAMSPAPADPAASASAAPSTPEPAPPAAPAPAARAVDPITPDPIGSRDGADKAHLEFSATGAGIAHLALPDTYQSVRHASHVDLQSEAVRDRSPRAIPFAVLAAVIDGQTVDLASRPVWSQIEPGVFECVIDDPDGTPLLRINRSFALKPDHRYGFEVRNTLTNLAQRPIEAALVQTGPIDLPEPDNTYGGDRRRVRFGYLLDPAKQGADTTVTVDNDLRSRTAFLGKKEQIGGAKLYPPVVDVWPNQRSAERGDRLCWIALSDRYFAVVVHPLLDAPVTPEQKLLTGLGSGLGAIDRLVLNPSASPIDTVMVTRFNGVPVRLEPDAAVTQSFGVYAGPMSRAAMRLDPTLATLRVPEMVIYSMGGICAPCTFQWLTGALMGILRLFHSLSGDWALAIMLLVVLVRTALHPVTRWSQIRMQRFGVQMQAMGPKQAQIKEKYKNDPKKLQEEMGKLWREEGINPAGLLGCLPMFLQTPVWMALYATLYFAIELRQQPAFYGVFQSLSSGKWQFLADLSQPDHAIPLGKAFSLPLWGSFTAINLLPIVLGFVFYAHQKFLTPPTTAAMTPEQEQQQKIIKVMMVVMFPLMMYAAPSGLALYFITNSVLGIAEHKWIRAHMNKHGMLDPEKIRAERKSKGGGFMARLNEAAERQRQLQGQSQGGRPPAPTRRKKK